MEALSPGGAWGALWAEAHSEEEAGGEVAPPSAFPALRGFWETAGLSTLTFLSLQCLLFTVNSDLAVTPVHTHKELLTFWGVFVAGL